MKQRRRRHDAKWEKSEHGKGGWWQCEICQWSFFRPTWTRNTMKRLTCGLPTVEALDEIEAVLSGPKLFRQYDKAVMARYERKGRDRRHGMTVLDELCAAASAPPTEEALRIDEVSGDPAGPKIGDGE